MNIFDRNPIFKPDYDRSILSLSNSLLKHYGVKTKYKTLPKLDKALSKNYKNVVFMIFDGMGVDLLKKTLFPTSFLRQFMCQEISSVFPSTTAAATTTFYSGLPPVSHGWLAWACYFKEYDKVIELFLDTDHYTKEKLEIPPVSQDILHFEHIFEKIKRQTKRKVSVSEVAPIFKSNGVDSLDALCQHVEEITKREGRQFILTYWSEPDYESHSSSPYAPQVKTIVKEINKKVKTLTQHLEDTIIIISSDHGHLPVKEAVYMDDIPQMADCLAHPLSMEERVCSVFLKKGKKDLFLKLFKQYLAKDFILMTKRDALGKGLFGCGKQHRKVNDFVGDFLVISKSYSSLRQNRNGFQFKGAHAGLTRKEMKVPLIIVEKNCRNKQH